MPQTVIRGTQILDNTVQRQDLDVSTVGQAVVTKLVQGTGISLSSTGADSGTGDVTVMADPTAIWKGFIGKSAAYTLTTADSGKYVICSGGSWTLTLPPPALGLIFQVRNDMGISGTTGTITLQPTGGTVDGQTSIAILPQQECTLITDGTNWRTFGLKREVILGTQDISGVANGIVLLPVGFRFFELEFSRTTPASAGDAFIAVLSQNGGATWITTTYYYGTFYNSSATAVAFLDAENTTSLPVTPATLAGPYAQSRLTLYPGASGQFPLYRSDSSSRSSNNQQKWNSGGFLNTTGLVNALKYYCSTGNIAGCNLTVKGVV